MPQPVIKLKILQASPPTQINGTAQTLKSFQIKQFLNKEEIKCVSIHFKCKAKPAEQARINPFSDTSFGLNYVFDLIISKLTARHDSKF